MALPREEHPVDLRRSLGLGTARRLLLSARYRYCFDTRTRNGAAAYAVRGLIASSYGPKPVLLDVGSGGAGVPAFLPRVRAVGVDLREPSEMRSATDFVNADIVALPFADRPFPVVTCIDVLEHLPVETRDKAIFELARVTDRSLLIACPHGEVARRVDQWYREACVKRGRQVPNWVDEHQRNPYPRTGEIEDKLMAAATKVGRRVTSRSLSFSEPTALSRVLRFSATRSDGMFMLTNLMLGLMLPIMPTPDETNGYRMILLAHLSD